MTPTRFLLTTASPGPRDATGAVEEGYFILEDGKVTLTDAGGAPNGDGREVTVNELYTARTMLRERLANRHKGFHKRLVYPR